MGDVPGWVTVSTTLGAAVITGVLTFLAPLIADWRAEQRAKARATREATGERNAAVRPVVEEVNSNLGTVRLLGDPDLASQAGEISDDAYQQSRTTLARYLSPEDFASLEELYAQFEKLRRDRAAARDITGSLPILNANCRSRVAILRDVMKTKVDDGR